MGLLTTNQVCQVYFKDTVMLLFGNLVLSLALQSSGLHRRIAVWSILKIGTSSTRLTVAFMLPTFLLSFWMPNPACVMFMLSILEGVVQQLEKPQPETVSLRNQSNSNFEAVTQIMDGNNTVIGIEDFPENNGSSNQEYKLQQASRHQLDGKLKDFASATTLGITYSAKVGGIACLTGMVPNIIMKGYTDELWMEKEGHESPVTFSSWLLFCFPLSVLCLVVAYSSIHFFYFRVRQSGLHNQKQALQLSGTHQISCQPLGPLRFEEWLVAGLYLLLIALWFFRKPTFMRGWDAIFQPGYIHAAVPAVAAVLLAFIIPTKMERSKDGHLPTLLNWKLVSCQLPWSVLLLVGGGSTLATACHKSGLSTLAASQLERLMEMPPWLVMLVLGLIASYLTEFITNSALVAIMVPIVGQLSEHTGKNPLYLIFPFTLCTSFSFMLPVAGPANAVAFSFDRISITDMMKVGSLMNVPCVLLTLLNTVTWGRFIFELDLNPWQHELTNITLASTQMPSSWNSTVLSGVF